MAIFIDRCIVIIRRYVGRKARTIGSCPMTEGGSSMSHVERKGDILAQHLVNAFHHSLCRSRFMTCSPLVKPATPELRTHQWRLRSKLFETLKLCIDIRTRTEIHGPKQVVKAIILKVAGPIALKQRYFVKARSFHNIANLADILLVDAVRTIFIFYLHHDDWPTILYG